MALITSLPATHAQSFSPCHPIAPGLLQHLVEYIDTLVKKGGPEPSDYQELEKTMNRLSEWRRSEQMTQADLEDIYHAFGESISTQTLQGLGFHKPHGYAGDYEIIDKIYQNDISPNPMLANWDRFVHAQSAFKAVKNRLSFFLEQVWNVKSSVAGETRVLNLASGPGRDLYESLHIVGPSRLSFDCVEQDLDAIHYAQSLCQAFLNNLTFIHRNVFRFTTKKTYHLIWSGGLFDYFNDGIFKRILTRLLPRLEPNGKLIIGNFSENNPTRGFMDFFDWKLYHRSKEGLRSLAEACGVPSENISIGQESEGVNLFLQIVRP